MKSLYRIARRIARRTARRIGRAFAPLPNDYYQIQAYRKWRETHPAITCGTTNRNRNPQPARELKR